jgi:hypothetical protein
VKRPALALARWIAARYGMRLAYPPRRDPPTEPRPTLANDGTPCAPYPAEPERVERPAGKVERFRLGDPK